MNVNIDKKCINRFILIRNLNSILQAKNKANNQRNIIILCKRLQNMNNTDKGIKYAFFLEKYSFLYIKHYFIYTY